MSIPESEVPIARESLVQAGHAILEVAGRLNVSLSLAVSRIDSCTGTVVVSGVGKSGIAARKIAATLNALGATARFLHAGDALHGDVGGLRQGDVLMVVTNSGETAEILELAKLSVDRQVAVIALTATHSSTIGDYAAVVLETGVITESFHRGPVPTTSVLVAIALGDAIAVALAERRELTRADILRNHPQGTIGKDSV